VRDVETLEEKNEPCERRFVKALRDRDAPAAAQLDDRRGSAGCAGR